MSTGGVKAHVAACGSLAGWFQVAIQAVDWFEHHLSMYWFKVSFLRGVRSRRLGKLMMLSAKEEKGKTFEKIGIHLISKKNTTKLRIKT